VTVDAKMFEEVRHILDDVHVSCKAKSLRLLGVDITRASAGVFEAAEPERPKPKFEVGQWVKDKVSGVPFIVPDANVRYELCGDRYEPCAPVCTEAQLSIRVGDEVRVAHQWGLDGKVCANGNPELCNTPQKVFSLSGIGAVVVHFVDGPEKEYHWLWNLEPVKPRA